MKAHTFQISLYLGEMRYTVLILLTVGLVTTCQSQSPLGAHPKKPKGLDENCIYSGEYTQEQRMKLYPFSIADTVKLVSFRYHDNSCPVKNDSVIIDSLIEQVLLTKSQINQFTDILYNNTVKNYGDPKAVHIASINECNLPRNAILFIDKIGKLRAYVLICFHCKRFEPSLEQESWYGSFCDQKFEMIRQFFISTRISYGTDLTINEYPGEGDLPPETALPLQ